LPDDSILPSQVATSHFSFVAERAVRDLPLLRRLVMLKEK